MAMTRRRVLFGGVGALIGAGVLPRLALAKDRFFNAARPLGVQLFPLDEQMRDRLDDTLAELARIGYRHVEMNRLSLSQTAAEFRRALERAGLACHSMHVPLEPIPGLSGPTLNSDLARMIDDAQTVGVRYITVPLPMLPERLGRVPAGESPPAFYARATRAMTQEEWQGLARRLNDLAAQLARRGLKLAYHNHAIDLVPLGRATALDFLIAHTDRESVCFELDIAWATAAGIEPATLLKAHPGRFRLVHIKEVVRTASAAGEQFAVSAPIGSVRTNWLEVLEAASGAGVEEYLVEQEPPFTVPPLESLAQSFHYLARL